jgi:hypothetical protein
MKTWLNTRGIRHVEVSTNVQLVTFQSCHIFPWTFTVNFSHFLRGDLFIGDL